ncbi:MAG: hypothetical protein VCA35_06910 [Roseibacillus sp.]
MRPLAITTLCTMVLFLHGGFLKAEEERSVIDEFPELAQALKIMEAEEREKGETLFVRGEARRRGLDSRPALLPRRSVPQLPLPFGGAICSDSPHSPLSP